MGKAPKEYRSLCICAALALSTLAVFWQVRHHEFISFDDDSYIFNNDHVKAGLTREGLVWAFTKIHAYNWHPLTSVSHMLDWQLFGSNSAGHHLTSLIFHIANTLLLFIVLRRMTHTLWQSAFVAALFALHPLHVESVAWASERKDVLSTFFWILTMWAYVRYAERPNIARYLLIILAFCLGLMAKQMLVMLPFVLLLLDYWPLGRFAFRGRSFYNSEWAVVPVSARRCILEKIPLLILSVVASLIVYLVQHYTGIVKSFVKYPLFYRIENAVVAYAVYIGKMFWPTNLAIFYPYQYGNLPTWQIMGAALLLVCITTAVIWRMRQKPYLAVGWLWYLGTLVPVIGLVQVGLQAYADRYTYMTFTGLFMIIAWGVPDLLARVHYRKAVLSSSAVLLLLVLGVMARHQVGYWRDSVTLYRHATVVVQNNWWAHNFLGKALASQGKFDEAAAHFTESLRIRPTCHSLSGLGAVLLAQGELDGAIKYLGAASQLKPDSPGELVYLAKAHTNLGVALAKKGRLDEAIEHHLEALRIVPNLAQAHTNLGVALTKKGRLDEAIEHHLEVLRIMPNFPIAHMNLGVALDQKGETAKAVEHFAEAVRLKPDYLSARIQLGHSLVRLGRIESAVDQYQTVLQYKPNHLEALNALARVWATTENAEFRNPIAAVEFAQKACELSNYEHPGVLDTLAAAYAAAGNFPEAVKTAEKALKLAEDANEKDLAKEIQERLSLYKSGQPYREK